MSDLISRQDAIRILACLLYADAQCLGEDRVMGDCIEEAKAWMSDAPSAEVVLQTPQIYGKSISPNAEIVSDLISRQDAMDYTFAECIGVIETLPSADRPTGEWIKYDFTYRTAICSQCEKVTMFEKWGDKVRFYNYCPNCGAIMVREGGE